MRPLKNSATHISRFNKTLTPIICQLFVSTVENVNTVYTIVSHLWALRTNHLFNCSIRWCIKYFIWLYTYWKMTSWLQHSFTKSATVDLTNHLTNIGSRRAMWYVGRSVGCCKTTELTAAMQASQQSRQTTEAISAVVSSAVASTSDQAGNSCPQCML
jgi:hypothetical protein